MIERTTAIALACHPYSSSSRIVQWMTRRHGKIATLLKGALRPKSPFLGEYELFATSELLYFPRRVGTLHIGKECALLHPRDAFRTDWRAMQAASYFNALFDRTTPEESPQPGLFELYEDLLDLAADYGRFPQFLFWAELRFCAFHGHAPRLDGCVACRAAAPLRFCAEAGGTLCARCAEEKRLATLECPPDTLAMLRAWQRAAHPSVAAKTGMTPRQAAQLHAIATAFMFHQFGLPPAHRAATLTP